MGGVDIFHKAFGPLLFQAYKAPSPYCYRCELGREYPDCSLFCADTLEEMIKNHHHELAGMIIEPLVQAAGGMIVSPPGYLKRARELCRTYNILFIADEVATGFGRTGKLFAFEHYNVVPDIICLAKSIAGGVPIGITVAKSDVMSAFKIGDHSTTFGGNPLSCAAACAAIDVVLEEKLAEKAANLGKYFKESLEGLHEKHKIVREVRGLGLMIGMEFRFDVLNIILESLKQGILVLDAGRNVLRFLPPLVITQAQINQTVNVLDKTIGENESERLRSISSN